MHKSTAPNSSAQIALVPRSFRLAFLLLTLCFAAWGLANNMTDSLVKAFGKIMSMSTVQASLVQSSFYGAYFCLAIPAAVLIKKFSYRTGVLVGLGLFIAGALLFYPASKTMEYWHFLLAIYVLASGLSILETSANPFVIAMGEEATATRRLNLAQSFNPLGSILGVVLAKFVILAGLTEYSASDRAAMSSDQLITVKTAELEAVIGPYMATAGMLVLLWILIFLIRMPSASDDDKRLNFVSTIGRLMRNPHYALGVIAQFFYVGAQICVWTYTLHYVQANLGLTDKESGDWLIGSIVVFAVARFLCTALMKLIRPSRMLAFMAFLAVIFCSIAIMDRSLLGALSLVGISGCMSLMFPTIYGIALHGLGDDAKMGGAGLVMAIVGGAILTPLQGRLIDLYGPQFSYIVPLACFIAVGGFALYDLLTPERTFRPSKTGQKSP